jgi:hypothetical protein
MMRTISNFIVLTALCCTALVGCNVIGVFTHAMGKPEEDAKYILPRQPTIVIVKDAPDPTGRLIESEQLASEIDTQIKKHDVAPLVPSSKAADLQSTSTVPLQPAEIAHSAGASQIVYVQIIQSSLDAGPVNDVIKGRLDATVQVIDAANDKILWPTDGSSGFPVSCVTPMMATGDDVNPSTVRGAMYAELGDKIAKLFYKYRPDK